MKYVSKVINRKSLVLLVVCGGLLSPVSGGAFVDREGWLASPLKVTVPNIASLPATLPSFFAAERLDYDPKKSLVFIKGKVEIEQGETIIRADLIEYDQKKDTVKASGNVVILEPSGNVKFVDKLDIKDELKTGVIGSLRQKFAANSSFMAVENKKISKEKKVEQAAKEKSLFDRLLSDLISDPHDDVTSKFAALSPAAGEAALQDEKPAASMQPIIALPDDNNKTDSPPAPPSVPAAPVQDAVPAAPETKADAAPIAVLEATPAAPAAKDDVNTIAPEVTPVVEPNLFDLLKNKNIGGDSGNLVDLKKITAPVDPSLLKANDTATPDQAAKEESSAKEENSAKDSKDTTKAKETKPAKAAKKPVSKVVPKKTEEESDDEETSEPVDELPRESRALLNKVAPRAVKKEKAKPVAPISMNHTRDMHDLFKADEAPAVANDTLGIKVENKTPKLNMDYELETAYDQINAGQSDAAIETYKNILASSPDNTQALFGLATLYHRARQFDKARPLYSRLLAINPQHRDGFNNFLVMLSDEAPHEALVELEKLEDKNPGFSTIPAQIAVIYQKLGEKDRAIEKMFRAVSLAPENLVYRYNLAIMLDKQKNYDEAAKLYRQLVEAAARGEKIPGNIENIQQRLTFISSNR